MRGFGRDASMRSRIVCLELRDLGRDQPVLAIQLQRAAILRQRPVELILLLEFARLLDVHARRFFLRALQVDLVFRVVGVRLNRLREIRDRGVPVRMRTASWPCRKARPALQALSSTATTIKPASLRVLM